MMTPFFIALQFLTVIPIHLKAMPTAQQNANSLLFYPIVGLLIGLILFGFGSVLYLLPPVLLSSLLLVVWIWLSGGLHLDGLADTADAWVGGFGDAERTLKIMKDPACGPIGVLSLVICCLLKWSALYILLTQQMYELLILIPVFGRLAPLFLFLTTKYVRQNGLGSAMAGHIPKAWALVVFILCGIACIVYFQWVGVVAAIAFSTTLAILRLCFIRRIHGITGDTVGASIEISEMTTLFVTVSFLYYFNLLG